MEKIIHNFPEYCAHSDGFIVSYKHNKRRVMVGGRTKEGYPHVSLRHNCVQSQALVHRLIALSFLSNPNNCTEVNHIDGNKQNNSASNLEWVTASMNMGHSVRTGLWTEPTTEHYALIHKRAGEAVAIFTKGQAAHIAGISGMSLRKMAEEFGCSRDTIKRIRNGTTKNFKRET